MFRHALVTVLAVATAVAAPDAQTTRRERLLNTLVGPGSEMRVPPSAENIGRTLATLAKATGALIGFETAMGEPTSHGPDHFWRSQTGLTLEQALDQIVSLDSRYDWRERGGVIHVRPKAAFDDADHFLNRRVAKFDLKDAIPLHATFEVHRVYRPDCRIRHPIYTDERERFLNEQPLPMRKPVALSLSNVTVLDILDAVVKAHGELHWNVTYRLPDDVLEPATAKYEYAVFAFHDRPAVGGWWRMCAGDGGV